MALGGVIGLAGNLLLHHRTIKAAARTLDYLTAASVPTGPHWDEPQEVTSADEIKRSRLAARAAIDRFKDRAIEDLKPSR